MSTDDVIPGLPVPFGVGDFPGSGAGSLESTTKLWENVSFKGKSATVESLPPYLAGIKTPLKDAILPAYVGAQPVHILNSDCTCGMNLAQFYYWACLARAENPQMRSDEVYRLWANQYPKKTPIGRPDGDLNLKMCCRTRILAPIVEVVVSKDLDASVIIDSTTREETRSDEPPPISKIYNIDMIPPPIY